MLSGFHLVEQNRNLKLGFVELKKTKVRELAEELKSISRHFKSADERAFTAGVQARTNFGYMTLLSFQNEAVVVEKSVTSHDLMQNGLMKKEYPVSESHVIGIFEHPFLQELNGTFRKRPFFAFWERGPRYRFKGTNGEARSGSGGEKAIAAIQKFLDIIPAHGTEVVARKFYFVHRHLEQNIDLETLAKAFKELGESLDR